MRDGDRCAEGVDVKVLCTCMPAFGHFHPMVPLARALADAGHEVAFATAHEFHREIDCAGFRAFSAGLSESRMQVELQQRFPNGDGTPPEQQRRRLSTDIAPAAMLPDVLKLIDTWRPDLLMHEEGEYTGPLAATLAGIPNVTHSWPAPRMPQERARRIGDALAPLWKEHGVEPMPFGGLYRDLYVDCCPPSLQRQHFAAVRAARPLRPVAYDAASAEDAPVWLGSLAAKPTVYVTLGTVPIFNRAPDLFTAILDALRDEPLNLIVTVGPNNDPAALGPRPENVHIERYVPHTVLLPHCDAVICHGGAGTTTAALAHGLPVLLLPRGGASQRRTAEACVASGVGRMLVGSEVNDATVRATVRALLDAPGYRQRARGIADEIRHLPGPDEMARHLEQWVERR
jgi:MGT family glycosyltransferase